MMNSTMKRLAVSLLATALTTSCVEKEVDEEETTTTTAEPVAPAITETTNNISTVNDNMVPGSLIVSTSLRLQDDGGDPCADSDGFFDCQPSLLKLYLGMGQMMVGMANEIITELSAGLAQLPNSEGSIEIDEEEIKKLDYKVTSATDYEVIIHTAGGPMMFLNVTDNEYKIMFDGANAPAESGEEGGPGKVETTITYTDAENFKVNLVIGGQACKDEDVRAPEAIAIDIAMTSGVVQGKAMMYMPRWMVAGEPTCDLTPTDDTKTFIYTDFVGNDTNTTAALYLMDNSVDDTADFASWEMADFCANYASMCQDGKAFGETVVIADAYQNNFCVTADDLAWGTNCESASTLISTPTFSDDTLWIVPSDLQDLELTLPSSL